MARTRGNRARVAQEQSQRDRARNAFEGTNQLGARGQSQEQSQSNQARDTFEGTSQTGARGQTQEQSQREQTRSTFEGTNQLGARGQAPSTPSPTGASNENSQASPESQSSSETKTFTPDYTGSAPSMKTQLGQTVADAGFKGIKALKGKNAKTTTTEGGE